MVVGEQMISVELFHNAVFTVNEGLGHFISGTERQLSKTSISNIQSICYNRTLKIFVIFDLVHIREHSDGFWSLMTCIRPE